MESIYNITFSLNTIEIIKFSVDIVCCSLKSTMMSNNESTSIVNASTSVDDDSVFEPNPFEVTMLIFTIITCLVIVTILFEIIKDFAIETSNKYTRQALTELPKLFLSPLT